MPRWPFLQTPCYKGLTEASSKFSAHYIADIPDLQSCSAYGETPEEALQEVLKAKEAWLEAAHISGKPIPEPRYRPVIYQAV